MRRAALTVVLCLACAAAPAQVRTPTRPGAGGSPYFGGGVQGPPGPPGLPGTPGATWYRGPSAPPPATGVVGDFYLDTTSGNVWIKTVPGWALAGNIRGPVGPTGPTGPPGPQGPVGPTGPGGGVAPGVSAVIDVTAPPYNARGDNTTDNTAAFQAAVDAAAALAGPDIAGVVRVPSATGNYVLTTPVRMRSNVVLLGDGPGSHLTWRTNFRSPDGLVFAWDLEAAGSPDFTSPSYRPDAFGKLDASAAPAAGVAFGYRSNGTSCIEMVGQAIQFGPRDTTNLYSYWAGKAQVTSEVCYEKGPTGQSGVWGSGAIDPGQVLAVPFAFVFNGTFLDFHFRTADQGYDLTRSGTYALRYDTAALNPGPHHYCVQIDVAAGSYAYFVDRVQVAYTTLNGPLPAGGKTLLPNEIYPKVGLAYPEVSPTNVGYVSDGTLWGARDSAVVRYQANGVGQPQRRADAAGGGIVPNDLWSYQGDDGGTVGFLRWNVPRPSPTFEAWSGSAYQTGCVTTGYWVGCNTPLIPLGGCRLENLRLSTSLGGSCVVQGNNNGFLVRGCHLGDGSRGISSLNLSAHYTTTVRDSTLWGWDSAVTEYWNQFIGSGLSVTNGGRVPFRFVSCNTSIEDVFVPFTQLGHTDALVKYYSGGWGGQHRIARAAVDNEQGPLSTAVIYAEPSQYAPMLLRVEDVYTAAGNGVPFLKLVDQADTSLYPRPVVEASISGNLVGWPVEVDGPNWRGSVDARRLTNPASTAVHYLGAGAYPGSITVTPP